MSRRPTRRLGVPRRKQGEPKVSVVAVTGIAGYLAQRLLSSLEADDQIQRIIGIDRVAPPLGSPKLEYHEMDIREARLPKVIADADAVVHLAFQTDTLRDIKEMRAINVDGTANVLAAAAAVGARSVVVLSSALVYGAHTDNPVPLTEDAPLRANEDFAPAVHKLLCERLVELYRSEHPDMAVCVFRAATVFGPTVDNFVTRMLEAPRLTRVKGFDPPLQVVHEDDVAAALVFAATTRLDGIYNLAADGWLSGDEVAEISGKRRVELSEQVAFSMADRLWRAGLTAAPAGELHYVMHPWVLDIGRLAAAGFRPRYTNRAALLEAAEAHRTWIALGRARVRKDSLAKGAAATLGAIGAMALVRRARRREE